MTKIRLNAFPENTPTNKKLRVFVASCAIIATLITTVCFSDEISHSVKSGLLLCTNVIIPSVFPFIILSDLLFRLVDFSSLNFLGAAFEKIFKINRAGLSALVLGILCGFPLGVKVSIDLYNSGKISKNEAERLIGFSNNTGPAFLISGIGIGLRKNIADGIILYTVMVISSIIVGWIFSIFASEESMSGSYTEDTTEGFSFTSSIKSAGINTLYICSYLTFFACFCGLLRKLLKESYIYLSIICWLEVGSATSILSKTKLLTPIASLSLSAFSVGFSGLSVHMQALSFLYGTNLRTRKYFIMKTTQGALCAILSPLAYILVS